MGYAMVSRTGNPTVDAVERFHFVEYGLITLLFYRAWRPVGDASLLIVMPVLAGLLVGTLRRMVAVVHPRARRRSARRAAQRRGDRERTCCSASALDPPAPLVRFLSEPSRRRASSSLAVVVLVVFAMFVHSVHLGYELGDAKAGVVPLAVSGGASSRRSAQERAASAGRRHPPMTWSRLSRKINT